MNYLKRFLELFFVINFVIYSFETFPHNIIPWVKCGMIRVQYKLSKKKKKKRKKEKKKKKKEKEIVVLPSRPKNVRSDGRFFFFF